MVFLLVGLTNKQFGDWTDPTVGGFILIGLIGTLLFILAESRAKEPIIPLDLWKGRTYSATMVSVFFAAFAFFGAIVFLPRWFQVVEGFSPTNSGLAALPLMVGLIVSSIVSGLIVSRTGRYKWLIVGSVAIMGFAVLLMTQLTKDTPVPVGVAVDVHRRPRRRPDVLGAHDRHPERRAVPAARRRDVEPDVLPPDRRHDRARLRRDDLRDVLQGQPGAADVGRRGPAAGHRRVHARPARAGRSTSAS